MTMTFYPEKSVLYVYAVVLIRIISHISQANAGAKSSRENTGVDSAWLVKGREEQLLITTETVLTTLSVGTVWKTQGCRK